MVKNEKFLERIIEAKSLYSDDAEVLHSVADNILCEIARESGYEDVVDVFKSLNIYCA